MIEPSLISGPITWPKDGSFWKSSFDRDGGHVNIFGAKEGHEMEALRALFPDGKADEMNFVLFSTSGVHGSYRTIEDVEESEELDKITFLIIQPRLLCMRYGNVTPKNAEDFAFLKRLRASSLEAVSTIGIEARP